MGGLYADVPGRRLAYHRDGSAGFTMNNGTNLTVRSTAELQSLNAENDDWAIDHGGTNIGAFTFGLIFPVLMDISSYYMNWWIDSPGTFTIQTSTDTTNGQDGTWTNWVATATWQNSRSGIPVIPNYRTGIQTPGSPVTGKKAIRMNNSGAWSAKAVALHLFGAPATGATRYLMLTDTGGTEVDGAYFDFDDDNRGGATEDRQFKVKNAHGTLTANGVGVSFEVRTDKSPSFADDYTFSSDGSTFSSTLSLGALAPGASSGTLYVRKTTPSNAALGLEAGIIVAAATSWT